MLQIIDIRKKSLLKDSNSWDRNVFRDGYFFRLLKVKVGGQLKGRSLNIYWTLSKVLFDFWLVPYWRSVKHRMEHVTFKGPTNVVLREKKMKTENYTKQYNVSQETIVSQVSWNSVIFDLSVSWKNQKQSFIGL